MGQRTGAAPESRTGFSRISRVVCVVAGRLINRASRGPAATAADPRPTGRDRPIRGRARARSTRRRNVIKIKLNRAGPEDRREETRVQQPSPPATNCVVGRIYVLLLLLHITIIRFRTAEPTFTTAVYYTCTIQPS